MTMNESSTERVRQYRKRQREASRKLVRFYLEAETSAKLDQLASGKPRAAFAEALLMTAIGQAWKALQAWPQRAREEKGHSHTSAEPAKIVVGSLALHPGRRRSIAASENGKGTRLRSVARNDGTES